MRRVYEQLVVSLELEHRTFAPRCLFCEHDDHVRCVRDWPLLGIHYILAHRDKLDVIGLEPNWLMRDILICMMSGEHEWLNAHLELKPGEAPVSFSDYKIGLWRLMNLSKSRDPLLGIDLKLRC